jgi:LysR family glycine cleavage system transcriptional activator
MVIAGGGLPPLNGLVAFEAVARHLSFTAAARDLRVTQAAISQQVKALEAHLGVGLVRRERPVIGLTAEGELLAAAVRTGIDRIADAVRLVRRTPRPNKLTVATLVAFSSYWLMPRLPSFYATHPEIELRLVAGDGDIDWQGQDVDLGITFAQRPPPGQHTQRLFGDQIVAVARPDYFAGRSPVAQPPDLTRETLLHLDFTTQDWMTWEAWFDRCGVPPSTKLKGPRFNSYILLIQAALEGQGIAMGWRRLVDPLIRRGELIPVTDEAVVPPAAFHLQIPKHLADERTVVAFKAWLLAQAAADW